MPTRKPTGKPNGRSSQLTPEIQTLILAGLQSGAPLGAAAANAKIPAKTACRWMVEGKANPDSPQGEFREAVCLAKAEVELRFSSIVAAAAHTNPEHAKWMLTHRFPKGWADKSKQKVDISGSLDVRNNALERLDALFSRFTKRRGVGEDPGRT